MRTTDSVTPDSIAAAKAQQQADRATVEAVTGLRIEDEPVRDARSPRLFVVPCLTRGCLFVACRDTADAAVQAVEIHITQRHHGRVLHMGGR